MTPGGPWSDLTPNRIAGVRPVAVLFLLQSRYPYSSPAPSLSAHCRDHRAPPTLRHHQPTSPLRQKRQPYSAKTGVTTARSGLGPNPGQLDAGDGSIGLVSSHAQTVGQITLPIMGRPFGHDRRC